MLAVVLHGVHYGMAIAGTVGVALLLVPLRRSTAVPTGDHARRVAALRERVATGSLATAVPLEPLPAPGRARPDVGSAALPVAAVASAAAAGVHGAVAVPHFGEGPVVGLFFLVLTVTQCAWAVAALRGPRRPVLVAGLVGNALVVAVWAVSRTSGVPLVEGGRPEAVGVLDLACCAWELVVIACCGWLLRHPQPSRASTSWPRVAQGWAVATTASLGALMTLGLHH